MGADGYVPCGAEGLSYERLRYLRNGAELASRFSVCLLARGWNLRGKCVLLQR